MKGLFRLSVTVFAVLILIIVPGDAFAQKAKSIRMEFAPQAGSPVQLLAATHTLEFVNTQVTVKNHSRQAVRTITFGLVLRDIGSAGAKPTLASSRDVATMLSPNESRSIDLFDLSMADAQKDASGLKSDPVAAELGILRVQFADGTTWVSNWPSADSSDPRAQ